ncbi:MAG: HAD-IA family hydrolase [Planctomycetota bacterium]|nr:HAD-IA family hydrolase [Planctomycetota bacterium]
MTFPFAGVIFDMDGVLCDSEHFICEAACEMFATAHRLTVKPDDFLPFVGAGENRYLGGVAEKYGVKLDLDRDKATVYRLYLDLIKGRLDPLPGAVEFIATCRKHGAKLAVASSADRIKVDGNLAQIGLPPSRFDAIVTGSDVQRKKPDPEVFIEAANRLGLEADRCLVVEDAVNGIKAGKAAGCKCLGLTTSFKEAVLREAGADWIAANLADVPRGMMEG